VKYDLIILYSGGTDSRLMLKMALGQGRKPLLVHVRYGQHSTHHDHEVDKGVDCRGVTVSGVMYDFQREWINVPKDYLPNRNMILVSIAAAIAEQEGIFDIWYGANASDEKYPDCQPDWINYIQLVLPATVMLKAPLLHLTQEEVIAELDDNASE
jgi:7-cyano-7-deazaguanine synthase in queuosine biosynthesis